ncbi:uncharacterized protein LOC125778464 [Bactrocera dorsalis]|uniref:Uncharacterized protein LOC125778464 n=1 Tax=Bactrocera dorsalis TaxID=27457 RepID=A0ABM3JSS5_BACDO|nr:uncharacterized protein LOC125778464 [Bactrocera dorsalis]
MSIRDLKSPVFEPKPSTLKYGVSPLHAWIRFLEFVLHLSYRIGIKKWQVRNPEDKNTIKQRKQEIQKNFWEKMGLHIDKPKSNGCGSTNDGNTARRVFANLELFASITNVDIDLLRHFHIILVSISCEFRINFKKFNDFCIDTADLYFNKYDWYPMSATVHKILVHSAQIMEASLVPVGCLGENASEARNKFYKKDRIAHARKNSRSNNIVDVFNRAMDSSDPLLSSICLNNRTKNKLIRRIPHEVTELLELPAVPDNLDVASTSRHEDDDENCSSDDDIEMLSEYSFELEVDIEQDLE